MHMSQKGVKNAEMRRTPQEGNGLFLERLSTVNVQLNWLIVLMWLQSIHTLFPLEVCNHVLKGAV